MEVYLIIGESNSGKSSLVRCLTGKGNDNNEHPANANVKQIAWGMKREVLKTLVLNSSLNERDKRPKKPRGCRTKYHHPNIHPEDVESVLSLYEQLGVSRAILCISLSEKKDAWTFEDYVTAIEAWSKHTVSRSLIINWREVRSRVCNQELPETMGLISKASINEIAEDAREKMGIV